MRRYVGNSPTNYTDSTGFNRWPAVFQIPGLEPAMGLDEIAEMAQSTARRRPAPPMGDRFGVMPDGSVRPFSGNIDPRVLQQMQNGGTAPAFCVPADFSRLRDRPAAPPANSEYDWVAVETASMAPVVGEVRDWGEAISGYDIYGNPLSWWERGITAAAGMIPYVPGSWGRGVSNAIARYGDNAAEWARRWWRRGTDASLAVTTAGEKIRRQMPSRGWTRDQVDAIISNPSRTLPGRDARYLPDGTRMNDPATFYICEDGRNYVLRNDRTGDIVQISNRNRPDWRPPWEE